MTDLHETALQMTAGGRGILAADESIRTMSQRLEAQGIEGTERNRRDYRQLLLTAGGLTDYVSGIIVCDETFGQELSDGRKFPVAARELGVLPGIKVDTGTSPLPGQGGALVTEGLDGLGVRLAAYAAAGAAFAKWRAVIDPATTTPYAIDANASALARYAALCQEHGVVPIVEPEVLCAGAHDIDRCVEVTNAALAAVFQKLTAARVDLSGIVLKPNFVSAGLSADTDTEVTVAEATYDVLVHIVPVDVPGIAFLSGGHSTERSCQFLELVNAISEAPWNLTFSFGRALVSAALETWAGQPANVSRAQSVLLRNCAAASAAATRRAPAA